MTDFKANLDAWTMERLNEWLAKVPSTNLKIVSAIVLDHFTFAWIALASAFQWWTIDVVIFGMWLGYLAALNGVAYKQFAKKRDTDRGLEAVKPPAAPLVAAETAIVTAEPVLK